VAGSLGNLGSADRYAYANDDPVNKVDPSGKCDVYAYLAIAVGIVVLIGAGLAALALTPAVPGIAAIITALTTPVTAVTAPALGYLSALVTFAGSAAGSLIAAIQCATGG
jgi:hypothetical protein